MAKQHQTGLLPQVAVGYKQVVPAAFAQGSPKRIGRLKQGGVFVKHRERIAQRPTGRLHTTRLRNGLRLQAVEPAFGGPKAHPTQGIEKIVQALAGGHLAGVVDIAFVSAAFRQIVLGHKAHKRLSRSLGWRCVGLSKTGGPRQASLIECMGQGQALRGCCTCGLGHMRAQRAPISQPGLRPINALGKVHGAV